MILKWMFPGGKSLPHVVVSHNARFDPVGVDHVHGLVVRIVLIPV